MASRRCPSGTTPSPPRRARLDLFGEREEEVGVVRYRYVALELDERARTAELTITAVRGHHHDLLGLETENPF